jgi:hypothetical protein
MKTLAVFKKICRTIQPFRDSGTGNNRNRKLNPAGVIPVIQKVPAAAMQV